jgi:hypothetical protein
MTILSKPLRRQLETAIKQARESADAAAREAIARIGVADPGVPSYLSEDNKALRRRLRAHARTLGDTRNAAGAMTTTRLQDAVAYEIWHRMLFGRFLAERGLLIHPDRPFMSQCCRASHCDFCWLTTRARARPSWRACSLKS